MGSVITCDILFAAFSIYIGIFFKKGSTIYPNMDIGFHVREICSNKDTRKYGNNFAGNVSIISGIIIFGIAFPLSLFFNFSRKFYIEMLFACLLIYLICLFGISKFRIRKKFKLKK